MSIAWSSPKLYERPSAVIALPIGEDLEAEQTLIATAEVVFQDCKQNGFSRELSLGYNVLVSAAHYLKTGKTMIGNRTSEFFEEAN